MKKLLITLLVGSFTMSHLPNVYANEVDEESIRQEISDIELQIAALEEEKQNLISQLNENFVFHFQTIYANSYGDFYGEMIIHSHEFIDGELYLFYQVNAFERTKVSDLIRIDVIQETASKIDRKVFIHQDKTDHYSQMINGYLPLYSQKNEYIREGGTMNLYSIIKLFDDEVPLYLSNEYRDENNLIVTEEYEIPMQ
ncbi:hypothetical protein ACTQ45_06155 [Fundicoccus sp. Sow4_D5]|uniref:hypothetical protein n=1 Tax=Fundicoccus sp. Sow4_D5 TaxID=3438782 RepID=UPI003F8DF85B